jgi:hypothetical protein
MTAMEDPWARIYRLHRRLAEVLGPDEADTLMELLRIPGWRSPERASAEPTS